MMYRQTNGDREKLNRHTKIQMHRQTNRCTEKLNRHENDVQADKWIQREVKQTYTNTDAQTNGPIHKETSRMAD